jgi:flagellar basal body-associated protein FliL
MSRLLVSLVVLVVVVIGILFVLGSMAKERPQARVETPVEIGNFAN